MGYKETLHQIRQQQAEIKELQGKLPGILEIEQQIRGIVEIYRHERNKALQRDDKGEIGKLIKQGTPEYKTSDERIAAAKAESEFLHNAEFIEHKHISIEIDR